MKSVKTKFNNVIREIHQIQPPIVLENQNIYQFFSKSPEFFTLLSNPDKI